MLPAIRRARTVPRKLTSTIRALGPWKYPKSLHQGKNEKNGIAEAIPFLSCPTMFSYREAPFAVAFIVDFYCCTEYGTVRQAIGRTAAIIFSREPSVTPEATATTAATAIIT